MTELGPTTRYLKAEAEVERLTGELQSMSALATAVKRELEAEKARRPLRLELKGTCE